MKFMKSKWSYSLVVIVILSCFGCKKYLDYQPQGALSVTDLTTTAAVDGLATAAYAGIANDWWDAPITSNWEWGSVRSDDAFKGGGDIGDQGQLDRYEQFYLVDASNNGFGDFGFPGAWIRAYAAVSRCNAALKALEALSDAQFPKRTVRIGEMHFLRGHMYFLLKVLFRNIPWIDEKASNDDIVKIALGRRGRLRLFEPLQMWFRPRTSPRC